MKRLHWGDCKATIEQQLVEIKALKERSESYLSEYIESENKLTATCLKIKQQETTIEQLIKFKDGAEERIQLITKERDQLIKDNISMAQRVKNMENLTQCAKCEVKKKSKSKFILPTAIEPLKGITYINQQGKVVHE